MKNLMLSVVVLSLTLGACGAPFEASPFILDGQAGVTDTQGGTAGSGSAAGAIGLGHAGHAGSAAGAEAGQAGAMVVEEGGAGGAPAESGGAGGSVGGSMATSGAAAGGAAGHSGAPGLNDPGNCVGVQPWSEAKTYQAGDKVTKGTRLYIAGTTTQADPVAPGSCCGGDKPWAFWAFCG